METIEKLDDLHPHELERVRATLLKRYDIGKRGNIVEVAFGVAEQNNHLDPSRSNAVCFYVRCKRMPRSKADRIPATIEIRIRRKNRFALVRLQTDVIDIGVTSIQATGRPIRHVKGRFAGTTGCIVAWKIVGQNRLTWGLLTVGHIFKHIARVPESIQRVLILSATSPTHQFRGTVLARSLANDGSQMDAALVMVSRGSLVRAKLLPNNASTIGKKIRPVKRLAKDRGKNGFTFPDRNKLPFVVARFLPISKVVSALGPLRNVIEVHSNLGNTFAGGRSGSVWGVASQVACIQHAGLRPSFLRGWGQSLESILVWATAKVANIGHVPPSQIDMRLIRII